MRSLVGLILIVAACTACAAISDQNSIVRPPAEVVGDTVVIPEELAADFDYMQEHAGDLGDIYASGSLSTLPLNRRRAITYLYFYGLQPDDWSHDSLGLLTFWTLKNHNDATVVSIAAQLGFVVDKDELYLGSESEPGQSSYWLLRSTGMTLGEAAWYADWITSRYSGDFMYVEPARLVSAN